MPVHIPIVVDLNQTMPDAFRWLRGRPSEPARDWLRRSSTAAAPFRSASRPAPAPASRAAARHGFMHPLDAVVAALLCAGMNGAWAVDTAPPPAPPTTVKRGISAECLGVGEIVEKIALWRDAGGAPQRAQTEIARRITDPDARAVAVSLVAQLYTGFARQMTPAQARQAYTASCALAQENDARAAGNPVTPSAPVGAPASAASPASAANALPARAP